MDEMLQAVAMFERMYVGACNQGLENVSPAAERFNPHVMVAESCV